MKCELNYIKLPVLMKGEVFCLKGHACCMTFKVDNPAPCLINAGHSHHGKK